MHGQVPLGTAEVRTYLQSARHSGRVPLLRSRLTATSGPSRHYGASLFVEKKGFNELFEAAKLTERFDIAILSTKAISVAACRELVDEVLEIRRGDEHARAHRHRSERHARQTRDLRTRIPVELILRKLGAGMTIGGIIADHPRLTLDDIRATQAFAADDLADEEILYG